MNNCFDCKHSKSFSLDLADRQELREYNANPQEYIQLESTSPLLKMRVGKCLLGHNERMRDFRKEHGNKTRTIIDADRSLDMECYEMTDGAKMLQSMIDKTDQILEILNKKDENR